MHGVVRGLIPIIVLSVVALCSAQGALLAYDPANYPATNRLDALHGGFGWRTLWGGANTVNTTGVGFSTLRTSGRAFTTIGNTEESFRGLFVDGMDSLTVGEDFGRDGTTLWLSFLFRRDRSAGAGEWAGVSLFSDQAEELFIGQPVGQNFLGLHLWDLGQAPAGLAMSSVRIQDAAVYLVVVRLSFGVAGTRDLVELFINPEPGVEPGAPNVSRSGANIQFNWIRLASGYSTTRATFDEIRIGTEYKDVVPGIASPVSAPKLTNLQYDPTRGFAALLNVETGYAYRVQSSSDFQTWITVADFLSYGPEFLFQSPVVESNTFRFFRAVSP